MRTRLGTLLLVAAVALTACRGGGMPSIPSTNNAPQSVGGDTMVSPFATTSTATSVAVCNPKPQPGKRECFALRRTDVAPQSATGMHSMSLGYIGYGPLQLQSAYKYNSSSATPTVAIVDAYDDPQADADLTTYRSTFGLSPCTIANGCFVKMNGATGSTTVFPTPDTGWAEEESLDVDMVSAICPNCHILLMEAKSNSNADLAAAVDRAAATAGVVAISNSYGGAESQTSNAHYNHAGIVITASNGDNGYGPSQPAGYATVVAVGGTRLLPAANARGWSETAWQCTSSLSCSSNGTGGAGSGCSALVAKPAWQTDTGCIAANTTNPGHGGRSIGDISAVADPATGVWVYDSYNVKAGFYVFGGTSVSSPIIASMFALAGNGATLTSTGSGGAAKYIWQHHAGNTFDVVKGTNEPSANGSCLTAWNYICLARVGYDGLTGWGTPNGLGAL